MEGSGAPMGSEELRPLTELNEFLQLLAEYSTDQDPILADALVQRIREACEPFPLEQLRTGERERVPIGARHKLQDL